MAPARRAAAAILLSALALAACGRSGPGSGAEATGIVRSGDRVLLTIRAADGTSELWTLRPDGGIAGRATGAAPPSTTQDCAGSACYRVDGATLAVYSGDRAVWAVSGADYDGLVADYGGMRPRSLAVAVCRTDQGVAVFVANGRDGVLHRDERGQWQRLGLPRGGEGWYWEEPPRLASQPQPVRLGSLVGVAAAAILLMTGLGLLAARRAWRARTALSVMVVSLAAGALAGFFAARPLPSGMFPAWVAAALFVGIVLVTGVGAVTSIALLARQR